MRRNSGSSSLSKFFPLVVSAALVAGCSSSGAAGRSGADAETASTEVSEPTSSASPETTAALETGDRKNWTVLVYSIADTDLEPFMMQDVTEMGSVGTSANLNMVALVDRAADYSSDPVLGLPDWQGAKLLQIGAGTAEVIEDYGDLDTGDPAVLSDFIARGIAENPAEHYSLIISDHGASWPGVGGDESAGGNGLTLAEIASGIRSGLDSAGVDKLDLLGFDACLMASYEVAASMVPVAERMVASQELEPGHGWDYASLGLLADSNPADADALGKSIIDGFQAQAKVEGTDSEITLSLIDLTKMAPLEEAVASFSQAVDERAAQVAPVIGASLATTLGFGRSPDPQQDTHMADLGQLVSKIGVDALDVSPQADAVLRALGDVVIDSTQGASTLGATGLSIYFPPSQDLLSGDYAGVVGDSPWSMLLNGYYAAGLALPADQQAQFANDQQTADVSFGPDGLEISGLIDPEIAANVAEAVISYGTIDDNGVITFFGDEPAVVTSDGSGLASGFYDLTSLTISDGTDTVNAYLGLTYDDNTDVITIDVPMAYYAPGQQSSATYDDVLLTLTVDGTTSDVLSETYYVYNDELGTYGELTPDPAGIIVPKEYQSAADGTGSWVPTSNVGLYAKLDSLQYELPRLPSGTRLYIELTVTDFGGNSDTVSAEVVIP